MMRSRIRLGVSAVVAFAIVGGPLFVPEPAEAAGGAMFRVFQSFHGIGGNETTTPSPGVTVMKSGVYSFTHSQPGTQYPAPTALVTPMGGFTIPRHVLHFGDADYYDYTYSCAVGLCAAGYPVSNYYYSYYNYKGVFLPQNPYAPTTTESVNRLANTPGFTTTQFNNQYAFYRPGSFQVTPGPNRFGGTMRFFAGLNARYYFFATVTEPCCSRGAGHVYRTGTGPYGSPTGALDSSEYSPQTVGQTHVRWTAKREHTALTTGGGDLIQRRSVYFYTTGPWTTGMIEGFQSGGFYVSSAAVTGYDNRTENREFGTMSLVQPALTHQFLTSFNPGDPITSPWHNVLIRQVKVTFMPEPGGILLMGAGVLGLVGVYRLRRR